VLRAAALSRRDHVRRWSDTPVVFPSGQAEMSLCAEYISSAPRPPLIVEGPLNAGPPERCTSNWDGPKSVDLDDDVVAAGAVVEVDDPGNA
jgi:hypothetical protein